MNGRILPERFHIISGSALKVIAVICMLIDHTAQLIYTQPINLFTFFGRTVTLYGMMRLIGRIAFPIFAFLIVEGCRYTRNRVRYGAALLIFALLSEIPWDLFHFGVWFSMSKQNVFFTLFLWYLGICAYEGFKNRWFLRVSTMLVLLIGSYFLHADYSASGFCFIILMYALHDNELLRNVIGTIALSSQWKAGLAFVPLAFYNGKRGFIKGPVLKYAFYLVYPLQFLVLWFIRMQLG